MSLVLELKPEEETALCHQAHAEGMTPDRFVARLVAEYQPKVIPEPEWKTQLRAGQQIMSRAFIASGLTDDELAQDVEAEVKAYRTERAAMELGQAT